MNSILKQSWQDELNMILGIYNNVIFTGNVEDLYYNHKTNDFVNIKKYLVSQLEGYEIFEYNISNVGEEDKNKVLNALENGIDKKATCIVINCSSQYVTIKQNDSSTVLLYSQLRDRLDNSFIDKNGNMSMVILVCDNLNNVPNWYYSISKIIDIPSPSDELRSKFINLNYENVLNDEEKHELVGLSNSLKVKDLFTIIQLKNKNGISVSESIDLYKYGLKTNPWLEIRKKLIKTPIKEELDKQIVGNDEIKDYINDIFIKKSLNMQGIMDDDHSTRPSGLFFIFGPSGTGKTEFAKQVTKYLKGDINSMIRIDCSEYSEQHDIEKLIGSPVGYIGCENGGVLTEGISRDHFSVVVIDEFEKANSALHDMFLQIMEDGRITDGMGKTVDCSQAIFFFTGNLGITKGGETIFNKREDRNYIVLPKKDDGNDTTIKEIKDSVINSMRNLLKPEFINRIGEKNVQVTNFISEEEIRNTIDNKLTKIIDNMAKRNKIDLIISDTVKDYLYDVCMTDEIRLYGHRGVVNEIETSLVMPLAKEIFIQDIYSGKLSVVYENKDNKKILKVYKL